MSVDRARDLSVFFSSPRVGFGEPPAASTSSSLLTFADMVLALDRQNICEAFEFQSSVVDICAENDHTYASSGSSRTTRSQTAKVAALLSNRLSDQDKEKKKQKDDEIYTLSNDANLTIQTQCSRCMPLNYDADSQHFKSKRSSSVENIHNTEVQLTTDDNKACEWPAVVPKNSPRKSCSFEEVSCDNSKSCLKSSKSSENVQRTDPPYTLHRFVNNTLEFPCWPRKADHTYATATWDGTAASHSLFEQELHQDPPRPNVIQDEEMESTDPDFVLQSQCNHVSMTQGLEFQNIVVLAQKDDHTYVKSKFSHVGSQGHFDTDSSNIENDSDSDTVRKQTFSSATFPRYKTREDHTYFHSGLPRRSSGGTDGREWVSTHTVASSSTPQDLQIEEAYRNLNSFSQSASAKKDHNYSTSA